MKGKGRGRNSPAPSFVFARKQRVAGAWESGSPFRPAATLDRLWLSDGASEAPSVRWRPAQLPILPQQGRKLAEDRLVHGKCLRVGIGDPGWIFLMAVVLGFPPKSSSQNMQCGPGRTFRILGVAFDQDSRLGVADWF